MLSGTPTIDVDEWMEHTKYHGAFKRRGAAPRRRLFYRSESGGVRGVAEGGARSPRRRRRDAVA